MSDVSLYDGLFRSANGCAVFGGEAHLSAMLRVEAALARAEARLGIMPAESAEIIASCCKLENLDVPSLVTDSTSAGNLAIPLLKQLTTAVAAKDAEAAGYVHWGATSQDIIDTALILQLRTHLERVAELIETLCRSLAELSSRYATTVMPGRTWLQQAVPVTFGLKAAGFLDAFLRHRSRLQELRPRLLVVQFGGAAGTLASLGHRGNEVATALAQELGLASPAMSWHAHRDRIGEVAAFHGLVAATLGKLGRDVSLGMQTELGEISEPDAKGRGGSSTMPHKRNPVFSATLLAAAIRIPGLVATVFSAMLQEHERGVGGWHAEWETLPELCTLTLGSLERAAEFVPHLRIDETAMRKDLDETRGLLMAESVSMRLAEQIGRARAHEVVEDAAHQATARGLDFLEALKECPEVTAHLDETRLRELLDPSAYLGSAEKFVDQVLAVYRSLHGTQTGES